MKKLFLFVLASLLSLNSCSNIESKQSAKNEILPKKIITTSGTGSIISSTDITYDGNKIIGTKSSSGEYQIYKYTGTFLTRIESYDASGKLVLEDNYTYANGKLDKNVFIDNGSTPIETTYTYNQDGTISFVESRLQGSFLTNGKFFLTNGNITSIETSNTNYTGTYTFEYDSKNSPTKNFLGYNLLLPGNNYEILQSKNNLLKYVEKGNTETFSYVYNSDGYPTERKIYHNGNLESIVQYIY
jgi:hypothetical protein